MVTNVRIQKPQSRNLSAKMGLEKTFADGFRDWEFWLSLFSHIKIHNTATSNSNLGRSLSCWRLIWVLKKTWITIRLVINNFMNIDFIDKVGGFFSSFFFISVPSLNMEIDFDHLCCGLPLEI